MTERDFIYWLQGYLEMSGAKSLDEKQVQIIKDHIGLVLNKVTTSYNHGITVNPIQWPPSNDHTIIC